MAIALELELARVPRRTTTPSVLDAQHRALTIGLLLTVTLIAFEALAVATVMPGVKRELGGVRLYGWAFSGFLLSMLIGIVAGGEQADRHGPGRPFAVALLAFSGGLAIGGLAPSMLVLVGGRALQGFGAGILISVIYAIIGRGYDDALRPQMFAAMSSAWVVPGLIGPAIAGLAADALTWRIVFIGLLPFAAIAFLLTAPALRHLAQEEVTGVPGSGISRAVRLALGVGLILGGATSESFLIAALLVVAGVATAYPALVRLIPPGTLSAAHGVPAAALATGLLNLAFFGAEAFLPFLIVDVRDASAVIAGLALTAATLTWTAGSWVQTRVDGRVERRSLIAAGLALVALGIAGALPAALDGVPVWIAIPAWGISGLGMGLGFPSIGLFVLSQAPQGSEGSYSASLKLMEVLGGAVGAGLGGAIVALGGDAWDAQGVAIAFALLAAGAVAGIFAARRIGSNAVAKSAALGPE